MEITVRLPLPALSYHHIMSLFYYIYLLLLALVLEMEQTSTAGITQASHINQPLWMTDVFN